MTTKETAAGYRPGMTAAGPFLAFAAACMLLATTLSPGPAVTQGSLALACWCAALLCLASSAAGWRGTGLAQWKTGPWLLVWVAATSGLATLTLAGARQGYAAQSMPGSVLRGLWITAAGVTAWTAGYCAGPRRLPAAWVARRMAALRRRRSERVQGAFTPWALYSAGTAARLVTAALTGNLGYAGDFLTVGTSSAPPWQQALTLVAQACPAAIALSAVRVYRQHEPGAGTATLVLFAAEISYGAISGEKQVFAVAVLAVAIPRAAAMRKIPRVILLVGAAAFLLVVIPFTGAYRTVARDGPVTLNAGEAAAQAPAIARQAAAGSHAALGPSLSYLAQRVQEIDGPAIIAQRTPAQIPYAPASQLVTGPLAALVPRALWPGKPIDTPGYTFNQEYYGRSADEYTSALITPWADLYRHGGWPPLAAGMLLLGCLMRVLDDVLDIRDPRAMLLVLFLFPGLVKAEGDWTQTLSVIPGLILAWLAVTAVAFRRMPSLTRDHP